MKNVTIIGAGNVGAHIASRMISENLPVHVHLLDMAEAFEAAQVLDLKDGLMFSPNAHVSGVDFGDEAIAQTDVFVITAGAKQKPGETRTDLLARNAAILKDIAGKLSNMKKDAFVLLVSNPVDVLTQLATTYFDLPAGHVIGSGTLLDTSRLRWRLSERFDLSVHDATGYVMGEHGDSEFVAWSAVNRSSELTDEEKEIIATQTREAAYEIIAGKGATFFGIGASATQIVKAILFDQQFVYPVSAPLTGQYGLEGVSLGVPAVIGAGGIEKVIELELTPDETEKLNASAAKLKELLEEVPAA